MARAKAKKPPEDPRDMIEVRVPINVKCHREYFEWVSAEIDAALEHIASSIAGTEIRTVK